jgi:hypothetical protein
MLVLISSYLPLAPRDTFQTAAGNPSASGIVLLAIDKAWFVQGIPRNILDYTNNAHRLMRLRALSGCHALPTPERCLGAI